MIKKEKQPYRVLYVTSVQGTLFRHSSVNPTMYFKLLPDEERMATDTMYREYMEDIIKNELLQSIVNKFILSQPLIVTNDHIPYVIFKGNIDKAVLFMYVKAILDELEYATKTPIKAVYGMTDTLFLEIGKRPSAFRSGRVGEKLSQTDFIEKECEVIEGDHKEEDAGALTPYDMWVRCKQEELRQKQEEEEEEIVTW